MSRSFCRRYHIYAGGRRGAEIDPPFTSSGSRISVICCKGSSLRLRADVTVADKSYTGLLSSHIRKIKGLPAVVLVQPEELHRIEEGIPHRNRSRFYVRNLQLDEPFKPRRSKRAVVYRTKVRAQSAKCTDLLCRSTVERPG